MQLTSPTGQIIFEDEKAQCLEELFISAVREAEKNRNIHLGSMALTGKTLDFTQPEVANRLKERGFIKSTDEKVKATGVDFSSLFFSNGTMRGIEFERCIFTNAAFEKSDMEKVDFKQVLFATTMVQDSNWNDCKINFLNSADLSKMNIKNSEINVDLNSLTIKNSFLENVTFNSRSFLSGVKMENVIGSDVTITTGSENEKLKLFNWEMNNVQLTGGAINADFDHSKIKDLSLMGSVTVNVDLTRCSSDDINNIMIDSKAHILDLKGNLKTLEKINCQQPHIINAVENMRKEENSIKIEEPPKSQGLQM